MENNKVNKVNETVVKVNVNQVKPQITFVKRVLHKYLVENKLNHTNSTTTKPQSIGLTSTQSNSVQTVIKNGLNELSTKYPHTTKPQLQYIKNHFNTHSSKYLTVK